MNLMLLLKDNGALREEWNFVQIRKGDPILKNTGKLVCCKAGDMIVWDSRNVHCNTPASFDVVAAALKEGDERTESKNILHQDVQLHLPLVTMTLNLFD